MCLPKNRNDDINFDFSAFFLFNIGYWCHYLIPAAIWRNKLYENQVSHGNATILRTILQMTIQKKTKILRKKDIKWKQIQENPCDFGQKNS